MKMKLNIQERLVALGLLPKESDFITLRLIRELKGKLSLSAEELTEYEVKNNGNSYSWNAKGTIGIELELKLKELELIRLGLEKLDTDKKLTELHYSLFNKIILEDEGVDKNE